MKTVVLTPFRSAAGRDAVWAFTRRWIADHYPMPVFVGDSGGVFSPGAARNDAAAQAGGWDVAVFHDSDTIAHPDAVAAAISGAAGSMRMVVAGDSHMYCDAVSSARIMASGDAGFARPVSFDDKGFYARPCSGVFAVNRDLFDRVGGYVESLAGWGYEDLVFLQSCGIFGDGNGWVDGFPTLHLWHPPAPRDGRTATNKQVWQRLTGYRMRGDRDGARRFLAGLGHVVP